MKPLSSGLAVWMTLIEALWYRTYLTLILSGYQFYLVPTVVYLISNLSASEPIWFSALSTRPVLRLVQSRRLILNTFSMLLLLCLLFVHSAPNTLLSTCCVPTGSKYTPYTVLSTCLSSNWFTVQLNCTCFLCSYWFKVCLVLHMFPMLLLVHSSPNTIHFSCAPIGSQHAPNIVHFACVPICSL
jgi:hypothetical protein